MISKKDVNIYFYIGLCIYFFMIVFYCFYYAPYGTDSNDMGFILGLAYQYAKGAELYKDIIYVRPPISIVLHSFVFEYPFNEYPVLISRFFVNLQIGIYSYLASSVISKWFKLSKLELVFLAIISFLFNAHTFPSMAWHTIDGIFFSVVGLYFINNVSGFKVNIVAYVFAILAAASKQPFYLTIPLILCNDVINRFEFESKGIRLKVLLPPIAYMLTALILAYIILSFGFDFESLKNAVAAQTKFKDLILSGVVEYYRDWMNIKSVLAIAPLACFLLIAFFKRLKPELIVSSEKNFNRGIILSVIWYFLAIFLFYLNTKTWNSPHFFVDPLFSIVLIIAFVLSLTEKTSLWLKMLLVMAISWASGISWGYTTVALFSSPSLIMSYIILRPYLTKLAFRHKLMCSVAVLLLTFYSFWLGNQFIYTLEETVARKDVTYNLGDNFKAFKGIKTNKVQFESYLELSRISRELAGKIKVFPNMTFAHLVLGELNPLGIDWLMNAEIGKYEGIVLNRIIENIDYALVLKKNNILEAEDQFFGSRVSAYVIKNWQKLDFESDIFDIYKNPNGK